MQVLIARNGFQDRQVLRGSEGFDQRVHAAGTTATMEEEVLRSVGEERPPAHRRQSVGRSHHQQTMAGQVHYINALYCTAKIVKLFNFKK